MAACTTYYYSFAMVDVANPCSHKFHTSHGALERIMCCCTHWSAEVSCSLLVDTQYLSMFEGHGSAMLLEASAVSLGVRVDCNNWAFERSVRCLRLQDPR